MRSEQGKFLAIVRQPRKLDHNYVKIKVDNMLEEYFSVNQFKLFETKLHCYFLGSLLTTVREFRTIKNCEFFHTGPIIFNPQLMQLQASVSNQQDTNKMKQFIERNNNKFNKSQLEALDKVAVLNEKDILLIQGPPGTGKTHTIHGIVSMICETRKRVLVCTPSNSAIDEIVLRLGSAHAKFVTSTSLASKIVRIGAIEQASE